MSIVAASMALSPTAAAIGAALTGGAVLALPDGAIGAWYATDYVSSPRKQIPNAIDPATSNNLFSAPQRLFSNDSLWFRSNATATDDAATGPSGLADATTVVGTGNWLLRSVLTSTFPAGTYTAVAWVKRNAGTDQPFALSSDNTATRSVQSATSAWQRFTLTFTKASTWNISHLSICSSDGATNGNIQVAAFDLFDGSSDLGPEDMVGTLMLGANSVNAPSASAGELNLSAGGYGVVQFDQSATLTEFTVIGLVSKTAAGSSFQAMLSKVQAYTEFSAQSDQTNTSQKQFIEGSVVFNTPGLWRLLNRGYHMLTVRADSSGKSVWLDKSKLFSSSTGMVDVVLRDLWVGAILDTTLTTGLKVQALALWDRAIDDAEVEEAYAYLDSVATVAPNTTTRVYVAEGDSITATDASYAYLFGANASPAVIGANWAVPGDGLAQLQARAADLDACVSDTASDYVLSVLIGANDLAAYTGGAAQYSIDLAAYCAARRAAGWKVVICTILPRTNATHNTRRAIVNADIATWVGVNCDAIADFAANADMGDDADASNLTYYSDGVHPTAAGQAVLEPILRAAINGLP